MGGRPSKPAYGPPATAADGAARIRALLVTEFDRQDGTGADWLLLLESLFRAGFQIADGRPDDGARRSIMRRVHEGAYNRLTEQAGVGTADTAGPAVPPLNGAGLKLNRRRPPR